MTGKRFEKDRKDWAGSRSGNSCLRSDLQAKVAAQKEEVVTVDWSVKVGQAVEIIEGPFRGLEVLVTHLLPAKERIHVLFEFLGRPLEIEISTAKVLAA